MKNSKEIVTQSFDEPWANFIANESEYRYDLGNHVEGDIFENTVNEVIDDLNTNFTCQICKFYDHPSNTCRKSHIFIHKDKKEYCHEYMEHERIDDIRNSIVNDFAARKQENMNKYKIFERLERFELCAEIEKHKNVGEDELEILRNKILYVLSKLYSTTKNKLLNEIENKNIANFLNNKIDKLSLNTIHMYDRNRHDLFKFVREDWPYIQKSITNQNLYDIFFDISLDEYNQRVEIVDEINEISNYNKRHSYFSSDDEEIVRNDEKIKYLSKKLDNIKNKKNIVDKPKEDVVIETEEDVVVIEHEPKKSFWSKWFDNK